MLVSGVHRIIWHLHTLWSDHHANSTNHLSPSKVGTLLTTFLMLQGFPGGWDGKESVCNVGDLGLIPGSERSLGEGNGNPSQYSCLENSMDRGTWWAIVHGITESDMTEWPLSLSYAVHYIPVTYLLYNWRFISLNPLYLFHPPTTPLPSGNQCSPLPAPVYPLLGGTWHTGFLFLTRMEAMPPAVEAWSPNCWTPSLFI